MSGLSSLYSYQKERERERIAKRAAENEAALSRAVGPTDPCAMCNVRPGFHDKFGCKRYMVAR